MGATFSDITLYTPTRHHTGTPEYWEERALLNYISDLYIRKMHGYKPPKTTRVTIQPAFHKIWNRTWQNGSIVAIAPKFDHDKYELLDKQGKYKYLLDLIQECMLQLSEEYNWDSSVFERAHSEVIACNYTFKVDYPKKQSRDKRKTAHVSIEKTETVTSLNIMFQIENHLLKVNLLDKKNWWWYDSAYLLAKTSKWFDNDRFGITYKPFSFSAWYSLQKGRVEFELHGQVKDEFRMESLFQR